MGAGLNLEGHRHCTLEAKKGFPVSKKDNTFPNTTKMINATPAESPQ